MKYRMLKVVDGRSLNQAVGKRMRAEREKRKLSQTDVAVHLGLTRAAVSNMEGGAHAVMLVHVYNLALYFDVPIRRLLP